MLPCRIIDIGRAGYDSAMDLQETLLGEKEEGVEDDYLIIVEHEPVVTLGTGGTDGDLLLERATMDEHGIDLRSVRRGGAATYHGPGQLVGYPILDLRRHGRDVHDYLRRLESCIVRALCAFGIDAARIPGSTGVWTGSAKIASIGIAVRRWITYHGFAVNVSSDLSGFETIVPCGMAGCRMTSVSLETGREVSLREFSEQILPAFAEEFGYRVETMKR